MSDSLFGPFDASRTLLLFGGKGGVGKTTLATATARRRAADAEPTGKRVLLLSTDPAHSLHDSLSTAARVPDALEVEEFAAGPAFDAFRAAHRHTLHAIVDRGTLFDDADIEHLLDLSLPGVDEVMAFLHLADRLTSDAYAAIIVDTAPTGHTLRLLDTPEQFTRWVHVLDVMLDKHRYMRSVFGRAAPDALDAFVGDMHARAQRVHDALRDPARCGFCMVTQAEPLVLHETNHLLRVLRTTGVPVPDIVINQWPPAHTAERAAQCDALQTSDLFAEAGTAPAPSWWTVPAFSREVRGLGSLQAVADALSPLAASDCAARAPSPSGASRPLPSVRVAAPCPRHDLLFVAGKGGVGKTTIAAATALRRAECVPTGGAPVLLVSTDPAHSLGTALGSTLSDTPRAVADGLHACEIDAEKRFAALRSEYIEDVRQFFDRTGGANVDLTYDRPVMEHLMDLAPPGIDEMMGLTAVMDFLDDNAYTACVLDAAPTGHLIRLLDMPSVFASWIRTFFRILQKYRSVLHLPDLSARLVALSKQVKALRQKMQVPGGAALLGVTLPTEMAAEETDDLAAHARRLEVPLASLVVNRVAGAKASAPKRAAHAAVLNRYRCAEALPPCAVVRDGRPPQGMADLRTLGRALYPDAC